jgi:hypothetical protein
MNSTTLLLLVVAVISSASALTCKFNTEALHDPDVTVAPSSQRNYDCVGGDRYCVYLEGNLQTPGAKNQTFSLRSCESDVKRYLTPISEKIGQSLDSACSDDNRNGKRHSVGPLTYWFYCCTEADCSEQLNGASSTNGYVNMRIATSLFFVACSYFVFSH